MLLPKHNMKETALHSAALHGGTEVLQKLWEWCTEKMSAEEVNELLLTIDYMKEMTFNRAARSGGTEVLQKIWEWGNESNPRRAKM